MNTSETWVPIQGYEGRYEVSNLGRIAVIKNGERFIRKPNLSTTYSSFSCAKRPGETKQKSLYIHTVVALHFIGPRPSGHIIRHLDGNRRNNAAFNLAYGLPHENVQDAIKHGTHAGTNNGRAILNERSVAAIRLLLDTGVSQSKIARELGVSVCTIHAIKTGRNWSHHAAP